MEPNDRPDRRRVLARLGAGAGTLLLGGCDRLGATPWFQRLLAAAEGVDRRVQRLVSPQGGMAREYAAADLSPFFKPNGTDDPLNPEYQALADNQFADWRLVVDGLVRRPARLSLDELRALPARTQITRHDCVEGWSCIGKWTGARLGPLLDEVGPLPAARYVVFHCADPMDDGDVYYESIDFDDAYHAQTILAYDMNDRRLPVAHGAPVRLRVERQLGYKMAKYVMRLELVESFAAIGQGQGGYWEDRGYAWYAGI